MLCGTAEIREEGLLQVLCAVDSCPVCLHDALCTDPAPSYNGFGSMVLHVQTEEFYVITWDAQKECVFEMPTGGAAIMRKGPNLLKLSRKEQCLALLTQLRSNFKCKGCFYRVFPNGEVQYLHPKDGVYPEKVNAGRENSNVNMRRIGQNTDPVNVRHCCICFIPGCSDAHVPELRNICVVRVGARTSY